MRCPTCGTRSPGGDERFCGACGSPLGESASEAGAALEERKIVSVLFCDLVGFTAASDRQDPEDVRARLRPYYARLRREIERYGATVEKFIGDAVMAVCGAPLAHEDDAERAVRAGLAILDAIAEMNEADPTLGLQVRVGVNTGEALVALGARAERGEGLVTGDVVNTAARIQAIAPVNSVAVGEPTYRATSRVFDYESLPPAVVKGKAEQLSVWRAVAARGRFGSDFGRGFNTPFVGREFEKPLVITSFERAAQQRSVQLVTIVGEPGVGKSRLISELFRYIDGRPGLVRWNQGRCLPYGDGITFWALREIVKAAAGILESDAPEVAAQKLDRIVSPDEPDRQWLLLRLAPLVGTDSGARAEQQELFTAWRRTLEGLAAIRETVLVFEDLHWADDALLAFLEHLVEWSHGVPLLILCAARPELFERRPGWGAGQRNAHTIDLAPLSDQETAQLISSLTATVALSPDLQRAVLDRAGGNPLYAEEFARLLADQGLDREATVLEEALLPDGVQALIAARLDTLPPERKALLQDAAVVGKVFWAGAVAEISGTDPSEVDLTLHELARKELIRPSRTSSMAGEREYGFWHVLIRDVAYSQIPRVERIRRHRAAAGWIERKGEKRIEDLAEVLAHHYLHALELAEASGDREQADELRTPARRFLALSGERAFGLDTTRAVARLERALDLTPADDRSRPNLLVRWADALFQAGRAREAVVALDEAIASLRVLGHKEAAAEALQTLARVSMRLGEGRQVELATEAVTLLEGEAPSSAQVSAYARLAHVQVRAGAYAAAIAAGDRACEIATTLGLPEPAAALIFRGEARVYLGDAGGAAEIERAFQALIDAGSGWEAAAAQTNLVEACYPWIGPARSLDAFEEAIDFCQKRGLAEAAFGCESNCPILLAELGRSDEAVQRAVRSAADLEPLGFVQWLAEPRAVVLIERVHRGESVDLSEVDWLERTAPSVGAADVITYSLSVAAAAAMAGGLPDRARSLLTRLASTPGTAEVSYYSRQVPEMVRTALAANDVELGERLAGKVQPRYPLDRAALLSARALFAEHALDHEQAADLFGQAAEQWKEFGHVPEHAYALLGSGRCLRALGQGQAEASLRQARDMFAAMGYQPARLESEALLAPSSD